MYEHLSLDSQRASDYELQAQLRAIQRRLKTGEDELQSLVIPEGGLFVHSFYGYALINMSLDRRSDTEFCQRSCSEIETILEKIKQISTRAPFNLNDKLNPRGGIIIAGHANLLRAGYLLIGGNSQKIKQDFHLCSAEIANSFLVGKVPLPPCYVGYTWAQDSIFALESLRLHDAIFHSDYSKAREAWLEWMRNHLDGDSGMMVAQVDPNTGQILDGPRGCALSWALAFLPNIDSQFAASQFTRFRKDWFVPFAGMLGIYEWYRGHNQPTQFHAGPVVFGLGAAATGIGIGTCRANGDYTSSNLLLRSLNTLGFPLWTPTGEKSYFYGQCLLADVLSLWGETVRPWGISSAPPTQFEAPAIQQEEQRIPFLIVLALAMAISAAIIGALIWRTVSLFTAKSQERPGWRRATIIALALQTCAVAAFFITPALSFLQLLIFMAIVDLLEEMTIRPAIVAGIFAQE